MPPVLTSIGLFKQALTGGAFEALAVATGDSASIIYFNPGEKAYMEELFSMNSTQRMEVAVFSPRFGDNQFGFRGQHVFNPTVSAAGGVVSALMPEYLDIPVYSTDALTFQVNAPAAAGNADVVAQLYYEDIPGAGQRLANWAQIEPNIVRVLGIEVTVTPGATGNYGTAVALNANDDRLRADTDYALLGYTSDLLAGSIGIKGPDTGFYRVCMPTLYDARNTAGYFVRQDQLRATPHIIVLNSNNKAVTTLDGIGAISAGATKVSLVLAELGTHFGRP